MSLHKHIAHLDYSLENETYSADTLLKQYLDTYKYLAKMYQPYAAFLISLKMCNLLVGKHEFLKRKVNIQNRPYGFFVDPANGCNLHCPGCVHTSSPNTFDWPNGMLREVSYNDFLKVYAPYATHAFLYNYGEPFLNPLTPKFIKNAKSYLLNTATSSNLSLKKLDSEAIIQSGLDYLIVSLDGATQEVYSKYRRGGNIDCVFDNLHSLISYKKKFRTKRPYIVWQFLVFEHNYHEIDAAKRLAAKIGVDELHLAKPFSVAWDNPDIVVKKDFESNRIVFNHNLPQRFTLRKNIYEDIANLPKVNECDLDFTLFENLIPESVANLSENCTRNGEFCSYLYNSITLDANNRILPCCGSPNDSTGLLVFDRFDRDKYSFNNKEFVTPRQYTGTMSAINKEKDTPHCYYCTPTFNYYVPHEHARQYFEGLVNSAINKCVGLVSQWQ